MTSAMREGAARLAPLLLLVALVILVATATVFAPIILQRRVTQALIMLVGVVGLYVFAGNSGVFSFGNVGFMAIGGFVVGVGSILLQALLPESLRPFREAFVFIAVALVLIIRPLGLFPSRSLRQRI